MVFGIPAIDGGVVPAMDQQPLLSSVARTRDAPTSEAGRSDEHESADELLAQQDELELTVGDRAGGVRCGWLGSVGPPVPDDHITRPVLTFGDHALEVEVSDGVVLDADRETPLACIEGRPSRDRPGDEGTIDLQPQVVVQAGGSMALDDESSR
jgi:hypothetical protein